MQWLIQIYTISFLTNITDGDPIVTFQVEELMIRNRLKQVFYRLKVWSLFKIVWKVSIRGD